MHLRRVSCLSLLWIIGSGNGCGSQSASQAQEAWDLRNNPFQFASGMVTGWHDLPMHGQIAAMPWADSYWPSSEGGIAARWRHVEDNFAYQPPSLDALRSMSLAERSRLSPAEKYDAYVGRLDYPLVRAERSRTSRDRAAWEGLCHGWAVASLNFSEPRPLALKSSQGIEIPFGSSDIKALLTLLQGNFNGAKSRTVGGRCNIDLDAHPEARSFSECRDLNAGAFHVILANSIGIQHRGFVVDVTRGLQVWNHPITSYTSKVLGDAPLSPSAAASAVRGYKVETSMSYLLESAPLWDATIGTAYYGETSETYHYSIEVDRHGQIVGGDWVSENHPDFLWMRGTPAFSDYFAPLQQIYRKSLVVDPLLDPDPVDALPQGTLEALARMGESLPSMDEVLRARAFPPSGGEMIAPAGGLLLRSSP